MKVKRRILLYGNSVILGTIGISLSRYSQFEVTKLAPSLQGKQKMGAAKTDILLFDLETTHPKTVFSLLGTHPVLQLIGISPDLNLIKIWSIRELRELSMLDLLNVINNESKYVPAGPGDDEESHF